MVTLEAIGFIGTLIVVGAYLPQIFRLWKIKNSEGISIMAWLTWLIGTAMILIHAVSIGDRVFVLLQMLSFIFVGAVTVLAIIYRKRPPERL